jgi:hypothetical protein
MKVHGTTVHNTHSIFAITLVSPIHNAIYSLSFYEAALASSIMGAGNNLPQRRSIPMMSIVQGTLFGNVLCTQGILPNELDIESTD